ncbi:transposase domain-containing protein [Achromobacter marplatensis]|uniref:transposase domain-containing protein n=1 Tax=Achromobacter marplatensis TaxID=470868 RepID=UPI0036F2A614
MQSTKLNRRNRYAYLKDVLGRLPTHPARDIGVLPPASLEPSLLKPDYHGTRRATMCWLAAYSETPLTRHKISCIQY